MKVPYAMTAAMPVTQRHQQMACALGTGLPRLQPVPIDPVARLSIAAYGPSLADTWETLTHPILSMSGATKFLAERGIIADYHCDMDPRAHKSAHIDPPVSGVHYLMSSVCPPNTWELLKDQRVTLWHVFSGREGEGPDTYDWVADHDRDELVVRGGSTIGLTAIHLGGVLGFRHFEIHGMDGSFRDVSRAARHAGPHYGTIQKDGITWDAGGVTYATSRIMSNAVAETINTVRSFPIFTVFHGHGLTQALVKEANLPTACCADELEKVARVRRMVMRPVALPTVPSDQPVRSLWDALLAQSGITEALTDVLTIRRDAQPRRAQAKFNTGSVGIETALLLRAVCLFYEPAVIAEVGTFIGTSTLALRASQHLYTCDRSNDCLPSSETRTCFPFQTSTAMLNRIAEQGRKVDLFFFDGRIKPEDVSLIHQLSHKQTVYLFDDYVGAQKGVDNVALLSPALSRHVFAEPYKVFSGRTTLAALVPVVSGS